MGPVRHVTIDGVRRSLSSVEAAALSGIGAAVLLSLSVYLLDRQPGVGSSPDDLQWYADSDHRTLVFVGLNLAALGIVSFLWFMAVFLFPFWLALVSITLLITRRRHSRVSPSS